MPITSVDDNKVLLYSIVLTQWDVHKLYTNEMHYFHFMFFILQPLHMFWPLQGHRQGTHRNTGHTQHKQDIFT